MAPATERGAFEALTLTYVAVLYSVAMSLARDPDEARDLVQETYYKAFRFWRRFQPGTHAKAWLLTILRHTHINTYRKRMRYTVLSMMDTAAPVASESSPMPEDVASTAIDEFLRRVVQDEVKQALDAVPEPFRLPVMLADLADCSYQEIADRMGCPVGTVMSRLHRGRKLLRQHLQTFAVEAGYVNARRGKASIEAGGNASRQGMHRG
jgi:RNA polymerase sigma-70 factor (ECF subfamily)